MPFKSDKQRKAMFAAAAGKSNIGIPRSVGKHFIAADRRKRAMRHIRGKLVKRHKKRRSKRK